MTKDFALVVTKDTEGAPSPEAMLEAPIPAELEYAWTVIEPSLDLDKLAIIETLVKAAEAVAVQISASPGCPLDLATSRHAKLSPVMAVTVAKSRDM